MTAVSRPRAGGFDSHFGQTIASAVENGRLTNLHAVLVMRHGGLVHEQYFRGRDYRLAQSLGEVTFGPATLHDARSVTKSVVGLLYGIALADGSVPALDQPLVRAFPEYSDLTGDQPRTRILVRHALTMTMGTEWDETIPYWNPANSERRMYDAPDCCRFALDRPLVAAAGERWCYNGGATALVARLISKGTGRPLLDYARERLLRPLGVDEVEWMEDRTGEPMAAAGLRLTPRGLAKIGQLVLNRGRWQEHEIVPARWIDDSTAPHAVVAPQVRYGYFWRSSQSLVGDATVSWSAAVGNGGQRVYVLRDLNMVVVIMAGNYDNSDADTVPLAVLQEFVLPAIRNSASGVSPEPR